VGPYSAIALPPEVLDSRITVSSVADGFVANWDYLGEGGATRQPNDFSRYEYKWEYGFPYDTPIWTSQVGDWTSSGQSGRAELTYDQNDVVFGTPGLKKPLVRIKIRTVNTSGLYSTGQTSTSTAKNPVPSEPTNLLASTSTDAVSLTWNAPIGATDNDLKYYNVYVYKASVLEKVIKFPHIQSNSSPMPQSAELTFTDNVVRVIKIKSVDKFDQESANFSNQISIAATAPTIVSDLKTRISAWSRADTTGLVTITTIEDHGLQVYSPQNINTVSAAVSGVRTITLASSPVFSVTDRVKITGLSTASLNEDVIVLSVVSNQFTYKTSDTTSPAITGTSIGQVFAKDWVMISDSSNGTTDCNTLDGIPVTIQSVTNNKTFTCIPDVAKITYAVGETGYVWHTGDIVKINKGSINVGNLESNKLVAIYPTSFSLQSGFDGKKIAITSEGIDGYKATGVQTVRIGNDGTFFLKSAETGTRVAIASDGISMFKATGNTEEQTVSLVSATGDATIVGKFSTGFSPNARVELDSGSAVPESIKFYSGLINESIPASIKTDIGDLYTLLPTVSVASASNGQKVGLQVSSYSRSSPSNIVTFNTTLSHQFKVGESVTVTGTTDCDTLTPATILTTPSSTQFTCIPNSGTSSISSTGGYARLSRIYVTNTSDFGPAGYVNFSLSANGGRSVDYYFTSKGSSDTALVRSILGSASAGITGTGSGTRTANTTVAHGFTVGDRVVITGVTPTALNETVVVLTTPTTTSFTYTSASGTATRTGTTGSITLYPSFKNVTNRYAFSGDGGTFTTGDDISDMYKFGRMVVKSPELDKSAITGYVYGEPSIDIYSVGLDSNSTVYNSSINMNASSYKFIITGSGTAFTQNYIELRSDGLSVNSKSSSQTEQSPGAYLGFNGVNIFSRSNGAAITAHRYASPSANNTNYTVLQFGYNGVTSNVGVLALNSSTLDLSVYNYSDYRLKDNIVPLYGAIEKMKMAKTYTFTKNFDNSNTEVTGFLAHELSEVLPYAVQGEKDQVDLAGEPVYQTVDHVALIPLISQAVHDLIYKVEALENQINQQNI